MEVENDKIPEKAEKIDSAKQKKKKSELKWVTLRNNLIDWLSRHKQVVKQVILLILVLLYFAYFGYAMWYRFGDEGSIRLLWVTITVVVFLVVGLIWTRFEEQITCGLKRVFRVCLLHPTITNWVIVFTIFGAVFIYAIVDILVFSKEPQNLSSLSGIALYLLLFYIFSSYPEAVNWRPVVWGITLQFLFALIVLRTVAGFEAFKWAGDRITEFLAYSDAGAMFVFGDNYMVHFFAFKIMPVVVFFNATVSVLYYLGVMQFIVGKVALILEATLATTAAESISAAGNIFLGQTEAPLLVKPFLKDMTKSEVHAIMTGGFATVAGSVMAAYIVFGVPASHLLSASVMSAPAALAMSKLIYPETEETKTSSNQLKANTVPSEEITLIGALSSGASSSIKLVGNILVNLIAFIAALQFVNATLTWFGDRVGIEGLTFQLICSYVLWPFALVLGVTPADCRRVAQMIGTKTFLNEFVAYQELGVLINNRVQYDDHLANNGSWYWSGENIILEAVTGRNSTDVVLQYGVITPRSEVLSTYALCGFANFSSIGMMIGMFKAFVPQRSSEFPPLAFRAMIAGNVACFMTACIAGLFYRDF